LTKEERRAHPRVLLDQKVYFSTDRPINEGFTYNLSPNGLSLISDVVLPVNSNIKIDIHLKKYDHENTETEEIVTVEGKVVWVTKYPEQPAKMGIEFDSPNPELLRLYMKNATDL